MSQTAPAHYVEQWKSSALHRYQAGGFALRNTTTPPEKITGEKMHFPIFGIIEAEEDVKRGDEARPQNANDTTVAVDTKKSRAFEEVFEDDLDQMTVDRKQAVAMRSAKALGRVHDKTIIRAVNASTQVIGDPAEFFSVNLALKARQILMTHDVDITDGNTFCAMDSVSWTVFSADKRVASSEYTGPMLPFVKGKLALTWNGVHYFQLSDKILRENDPDGEATPLMWHRSAMGFGYVRQLTGTVVWDNRYDCWTHNMRMRIGSKLLLEEGAVKMKAKYDAATMVLPNP